MNWKQDAMVTTAIIIIMLLALVIISPILNPGQKENNNSTIGNITNTSNTSNTSANNTSKENLTLAPTPKKTANKGTMLLYIGEKKR
jgi:hypothetical protein